MHNEQRDLEQKNRDLSDSLKDRSRSHQQLDKLYKSLKAQVMSSAVQNAASDDAEQTIQMVTGVRPAPHDEVTSQIPGFMMGTPRVNATAARRRPNPGSRGGVGDVHQNTSWRGSTRGHTSSMSSFQRSYKQSR